MPKYKSEFLNRLDAKGLIHQFTNIEALDELMSKQKITAYIGYDCTAKSLHVGNLVTIIMIRELQKCGHKPIIVLGGATTRIGDPTGKNEMRKMLSEKQIVENKKGIKKSLEKFIKFGNGKTDAVLLDNNEWISKLSYIDFLRDIGPHFSVNRMLSFESVKIRLEREEHMSLLEFNYMVLQAYDFWHLYKKHGCMLQLCGADQWGNVVAGVELTRKLAHLESKDKKKKLDRLEVYGLSAPLLTTTSGQKMGKSEGNALWLNEDMLAPYDYFQYFRNVDDADVIKMLKIFTDLSQKEIEKFSKLKDQKINDAKKILAFEATKMCHGETEAKKAQKTAEKIFEKNTVANLKAHKILKNEIKDNGKPLVSLLRDSKLCESGGEAKRLIKGGAIRINDEQITDENYVVPSSLADFKLSAGKKKHIRVVFGK